MLRIVSERPLDDSTWHRIRIRYSVPSLFTALLMWLCEEARVRLAQGGRVGILLDETLGEAEVAGDGAWDWAGLDLGRGFLGCLAGLRLDARLVHLSEKAQ